MKKMFALLRMLMLLISILSIQSLAAQNTYYVNDNSTAGDLFTSAVGNNANAGTAAAPFATLQYAVTTAAANDIIYVDAGTYAEQVIINKGITIIGAGQTLTSFTPPATTLVPAPGSFTEIGLFETTQGIGDVHISNLSINSNGGSQNIVIQSGGSVKNCTLLNGGQGIFFRVESAVKSALIENNTIQPNGIGINCQGSGLTAIIRNNTISKVASYYAGIFAGLDFGPLPQLTIQNNIINNFNGEGIVATSFNGTYTLNSITGTGTNAINRNGNGGNTPIATCNWFGTSNPATIASKIVGTVIYSPFLTDGTDGSSNVGFQPIGSCGSGNTYYVNDNSLSGDVFTTAVGNDANAGTVSAPFATLQYAVNTAAANDIIYVDAGTYTEQVTITKGITIIGAGQNATSILKPATTVPPPGPFTEQGVIQTAQNIGDVNIKDISVTGDYTVNVTPIIIQSGGSVRNCSLQSGNQGLFVRVDPATNPSAKTFVVEGNIMDAEYIAVNFEGANITATLNNNTLTANNTGFSAGMFANLNRITATNNLFGKYFSFAILINAANASITQNAFTGTGSQAINRTGGATITANCNWYGVANVSAIVPKITAGVNYYPWYVDGTDASPAAGFQHYTESCGATTNVYYVNDNSTAGDIFTTTVGNDANAGTSPTTPLATFGAALTKASPGAVIYMDAGTYTAQDATINKQVNVIGTNYNVSPNSAADPLLLNSTRNAETIIENTNWIIGANSIYFDGLTFNPLGKQAITLNNTTWGDTRLLRNRLRISSNLTQLNFTGSGTATMAPSAIANYNLNIRENRFEKEDATSGLTLNISRFGGVNISNNSFVVTGTTVRTQTAISAGGSGVVNYLYIGQNTFDRASSAVSGNRLAIANINYNKIINTNTAFGGNNTLVESSEVYFNYNTLDGSGGILPFVFYTRSGGNAVGATSLFKSENNTSTVNAIAVTTTILGSYNIAFTNTVLSPSLILRGNKITYGGDLSSIQGQFIRPIAIRGNLANATVDNNELTLSGTNLQPNNPANVLPTCPAISLYSDIGSSAVIPAGAVINILNNKVQGFKYSFIVFDPTNAAGTGDAYTGFGNLQPGITVNVNNNSFIGDSVSINNGGTSQPVLATCNWYGSADAAIVVPKISTNVTYSPWLTNGTDIDAATGFQPLSNVCNGRQNKFYVNDADITGDVFTTAVGNDANTGIPSAPLATLQEAINRAQNGDEIYMDAGTYANIGTTIGKSLIIRGANYLISPNDASVPLTASAGRNAETIINTSTFTIGASDITFSGFTFSPQTASQFVQTNNGLEFDNFTLSNNIFRMNNNAGNNLINLIGKQANPLVTSNYIISNNRFVKESGTTGTSISINSVENTQIQDNVFTTDGALANAFNVQNGIIIGSANGSTSIMNNTAYRFNIFTNGIASTTTLIKNNKNLQCFRFALASSGNPNPNQIEITDNIITNPTSNGGPVISYVRNNGVNLSSPNIARIEQNTITLDATGMTNVAQALIAPTLDPASANTQVFIRNNKLTITGDFSSLSSPSAYVSAIRYLNNSRYTLVENNEMEFTATNYNGANKFGIGILHVGLQPGTGFNFLNNKFSGFNTSIGIQNNGNGGAYGELPAGVVLNISYNSFTGDVMSINNGTTGQSANASCNWYGSASAQNFINKLTLPTVDIVPWLTNGTDNDVATGFQPVPNSCDGYPTLITLNGSTNVTCNGAANGSIDITTSYGKAPFTYTWTKDGDANFVSNNEDPTGLAPGTYRLAITDGNGSNIYIIDPEADGPGTIVVTITEPDILTATADGTNTLCNGQLNGNASVTVGGGTAPYTYLWSNGSTSQNINNLAAGIYNVTVTDANGCTATSSYEVTQPTLLTASANGTNVSCFNGTNGSATVTSGGGTAPYIYLWSNGATSSSISSLAAGVYNVTVTDANGCTALSSYEVTQPSVLTASANGTNVSCFNGTNGSASVSAGGGTAPYTYLWSNGATVSSISSLAAGIYSVTVTDANSCTTTASYEVTQPAILTAAGSGTNVSCFNGTNGSASVNVGGGTAPYTYLWSNGASSSSISNLAAGIYSVTITDANSCTTTASYQVTQPALLTVTMTGTTASCNGSTTATPAGGTAPYTYLWSNGSTTQTISNVQAGTYTVTVKDANNCTVTGSFTITGNSNINPATSLVNVSCFGGNNGSITVTSAGGIAPRTYNLNGSAFQSSNVFSNLTAGVYIVGVKDATGCSDFVTRTITQPPLLTVTTSSIQSTCFGQNTGAISITVSGGSAGAKAYSWTGPNGYTSAAQNPNKLFAGNYSLLVTDSKGCTAVLNNVTVASFGEIFVASSVTNVLCRGSVTGAINLTVSGGTGSGFTYAWSGATVSTNEDLSNLGAANNYKVTITDVGSGCFVTRTFAVTQPAVNLSVSTTFTNVTGCNSPGSITATGAGGTAPYSFNINGGAYQLSGSFTGLSAGSYTIGIRDANGCTASTTRTINDFNNDSYEPNNGRNQSKPISIGTTINARISLATDIADWFTFTTPTGGGSVTYSLIVTHPSVTYTFDLYPGTGNGGSITPSSIISSTRKDYLLTPGTTYRISVTSATLSFTCYNLSIAPSIPITARFPSAPALQTEIPKVFVTDVLISTVYPNPHRGSFTLRIESPEEGIGTVEMYNVNGQLLSERKVNLMKGKGNQVQYNNMNQAILFYRVRIGKHIVNGKIIGAN